MGKKEIVFGRYELDHRVGAGSMGTVYRAVDLQTEATVALKIYEGSLGGEGLEKFKAEAAIIVELRHPALVRYLAFGSEMDLSYLAMEWLEGETLESRLKRGPLSPREAIDLGIRLAEALGALHARGLIHKDIRPRSVALVGGELLFAKVLDLGVERIGELVRARPPAAATIRLMPPEQLKGGAMDGRADVFALGGLLFRCVSGRDPFPGEDAMSVMEQIVAKTEVPRLAALRPETPGALSDLVARMLAKKRDDRPADGAAIARALSAI